MIPADIKEMAKHDDLVAEILAMGGPFFFKEYQMMRVGQTADVVRSRIKKATWALILFVAIWGLYIASSLWKMNVPYAYRNSISVGLGTLVLVLYVGSIILAEINRRRLRRLQARIDAGEFSAD
jgi:hypothetical protein